MDEILVAVRHPKIPSIPTHSRSAKVRQSCCVAGAVLQANVEVDDGKVAESALAEEYAAVIGNHLESDVFTAREGAHVKLARSSFLTRERILARPVIHRRRRIVVQGFRIGAAGEGEFALFSFHADGVGRLVLPFRNRVVRRRTVDGHVYTSHAGSPAVVVQEEVVATWCCAAVAVGLLELVVGVHQLHVVAVRRGQRPEQVRGESELEKRIWRYGFKGDEVLALIADRKSDTRAVVVVGLRIVVQGVGVGASPNREVGAIAFEGNPCPGAHGLARIVEGHVIAYVVVVATNGLIHVFALARVEARTVLSIGFRVVVQRFRIRTSVDGKAVAVSKANDLEGLIAECLAEVGVGDELSGVGDGANGIVKILTFAIVHA